MDYSFVSQERNETVRLSDVLKDKPVLLVLLRHLG